MNEIETILHAKYDKRKSFYGKAKVIKTVKGSYLISYSTKVAEIDTEQRVIVFGSYSPTTTRHIKEYLKQNGFKADNTKQILKDYGKVK